MEKVKEKINQVLTKYLDVLDSYQREVDNIRQMHHEIWKTTQPENPIIQHRVGSRVERQTRITRGNQNTNINWLLEVKDVGCHFLGGADGGNGKISFQFNHNSCMYGTILVQCDSRKALCQRLPTVFNEDTFLPHEDDDQGFLLKPTEFQNSVLVSSGFEYKPEKKPKSSASLVGKGVINTYDVTACLRLSEWPNFMIDWTKKNSSLFPKEWRDQIYHQNIPIFAIPGGDSNSDSATMEFRLSCAMIEVEMFSQLNSQARKLIGITKFIFQNLFSSVDLFSWFHIKYLVIDLLDNSSLEEIEEFLPLDFVFCVFSKIKCSLESKYIKNIFMDNDNIFPVHKITKESITRHQELFEGIEDRVIQLLISHICEDLKLPEDSYHDDDEWYEKCNIRLREYKKTDFIGEYIAGYLTRLLSVVTLPLHRDDIEQNEAVQQIIETFARFSHDKHIRRLVPIVNESIQGISDSDAAPVIAMPVAENSSSRHEDDLTQSAVKMFEKALKKLSFDVSQVKDELVTHNRIIGISVTKFHRHLLPSDKQIQLVISMLEKCYGTCPRFYVHPTLLFKHFQLVQFLESCQNKLSDQSFQCFFNGFLDTVQEMSDRVPYYGKLSYKFTALFLLKAHVEHLQTYDDVTLDIPFDLNAEIEKIKIKKGSGNFDLK